MSTAVQKNLVTKNEGYASSFKEAHLASPPAKKYAVGQYYHRRLIVVRRAVHLLVADSDTASHMYGRP